jgi:hypothetical protein
MQLPRKLGQLGSSLVAADPYKAGPLLSVSVVSSVEFFVNGLRRAGIATKGGLSDALGVQVLQQLMDSGFFESMQCLMEATSELLERCTAAAEAAAPAAAGSRAGLAAAAAVAGANFKSRITAGRGFTVHGDCLSMLQDTAEKLMDNYIHLHSLCPNPQETVSSLGSTTSAAAHLCVAGMRHISVVLPQQGPQQQQQQEDLPKGVLSLAYGIAYSTMMAATIRDRVRGQLGSGVHALLGRGPHFVVWSDMTLLLVTYANIFKDKGQLPVISSMGERSARSGSGSVRALTQRQQQQAAAAVAAAAATATEREVQSYLN